MIDPKRYPNRIIFVDNNVTPPLELMNCTACNQPVEFANLYRNRELCMDCYKKWSIKFTKEWLKQRFGEKQEKSDDSFPMDSF